MTQTYAYPLIKTSIEGLLRKIGLLRQQLAVKDTVIAAKDEIAASQQL